MPTVGKGKKKKVFGYGTEQKNAAARYAKKTGQKVKSKKTKTKLLWISLISVRRPMSVPVWRCAVATI